MENNYKIPHAMHETQKLPFFNLENNYKIPPAMHGTQK